MTTADEVKNEPSCDPDETILDLADLKARCLGNLDLVERVLVKFAGQLEQDLDEMEQAIRVGDAAQAAQLAHRIKGIAASVAARSLFGTAATAEEHALENEIDVLPQHLNRLRADRSRLIESLQRSGRNVS